MKNRKDFMQRKFQLKEMQAKLTLDASTGRDAGETGVFS